MVIPPFRCAQDDVKLYEDFIKRLKILSNNYPKLIKDVRGKGLMIGIELHDLSSNFSAPVRVLISPFDERLKGSITGFIGSLLLNEYNIIVGFTEYNRNVIRLHPPLISKKENIDYFIESFEKVLQKGVLGIIKSFIKNKL